MSSASVEESHYRGLARSLIESLPLFRSLRVQEAVGRNKRKRAVDDCFRAYDAIKCPFYSQKTGSYGNKEVTQFGDYGVEPLRKKRRPSPRGL